MGSQKSSLDYCDPETLAAIEEAFEAAWADIQECGLFRGLENDCELKAALSQRLGALVVEGITDPVELRRLALEGLTLEQFTSPKKAGVHVEGEGRAEKTS
jgi:hypothetical protein